MSADLGASEVAWHLDFDTASAQVPAASDSEPVPTQLDELFEIQRTLGSGGMGVVYQALDRKLDRLVALKLVKASVEERDQFRLQAEGRATASLVHPGVVQVHGAGVASGRVFVVYELVEGGRTLEEVFPESSLEERLEWVSQVAEALGAAHALGIVHRDIKGQNVLVDGQGRARVLDFGIAISPDEERLTLTGEVLGTPHYMAPERFDGGESAGPRVDVWSLGVLLYQALTGELPYQAGNLMRLVALLQSRPTPPGRVAAGVPPAVEAVCLRCLALDPSDRYSDGAEVAEALRRARAEKARRVPSKVLLAVPVLIGIALAFAWSRDRPRVWETSQEVEAFLEAEAPEAWRSALTRDSFASPELRGRVAFALAGVPSLPSEERLAHAAEAAAASPSWRVALLQARLQADQGAGAEVASSLLDAHSQGAPDAELERVLVEVLEGEGPGAQGLLRGLLADPRPEWAPRRWLEPAARALLSSGRLELAADLIAKAGDLVGPEREGLLRAQLARARGEDLRPVLEEALARAPSSRTLPVELALAYFEVGDPSSGEHVLKGHGAESPGPARRLQALVRSPRSDAPLPWRLAIARADLLAARRELALSRRASALAEETRLDRARAAVRRVEVLAVFEPERAALESAWTPAPLAVSARLPGWAAALQAEALLRVGRGRECLADAERLPLALRGQVLWAAGRGRAALPVLEEASRDLLVDRATLAACQSAALAHAPRRAQLWRARLRALAGQGQEEGQRLLAQFREARTRGSTFEDEVERLRAIVAIDPGNLDAHHYLGRALFARGEPAGLEHALRVAARAPRLLAPLCRIALQSSERKEFVRVQEAGEIRAPISQAFVAVMGLEAGGAGNPAQLVADLDEILGEDPANQAARTLRAFVAIRAGRLGLAEADLACVLEDDPRASQAFFYRALLAGARRAPAGVLENMRSAKALGFYRSREWRAAAYPELRPYLHLPGFETFGRRR